jgi:hypothetical protein
MLDQLIGQGNGDTALRQWNVGAFGYQDIEVAGGRRMIDQGFGDIQGITIPSVRYSWTGEHRRTRFPRKYRYSQLLATSI